MRASDLATIRITYRSKGYASAFGLVIFSE
jgi:hypothetical protein